MTFNAERASSILCDAAYLGDAKAAEKWKCTTRTIENHRARLKTDPNFSVLFETKRRALEGNWRSELARALRVGVRKMATMIEEITGPTASNLEAVTNAVKALSEIQITTEVLNAGDAEQSENGSASSRAVA